MTEHQQLTSDEIFFTNVFNAHRGILAAFANCKNREELHIVRDGFFLAMASDLCPDEYQPIQNRIGFDPKVLSASDIDLFRKTIESARKSPLWENLIRSVKAKGYEVNSNLDEIWMILENGRLEWLTAASSAHSIKLTLQSALEKDAAGGKMSNVTEGDISDAKMIWIYSLSLNIPSLKDAREAWQNVVQMVDPIRPLVGYNPKLWDPRKDEWKLLDLGIQTVAEGGGCSSIEEAWMAK